MHPDAADVARGFQAQMAPRLAAVVAAVDAVAVRDVDPDLRLAHAGVDRAVRGRRDGDGAHGAGAEVAVGDVAPEPPGVGGLPDAAGAGAEVEHQRLHGIAGDGHHAAPAVRADRTPAHRRQRPNSVVLGSAIGPSPPFRCGVSRICRWRANPTDALRTGSGGAQRAVPATVAAPASEPLATMRRVASTTRSTCAGPMCRFTTRRMRVGGRDPPSTPSSP